MSKPWTIYGLHDPRTGAIRYVGFTTATPAKRLKGHISHALTDRRLPVHRWIAKLLRLGLFPFVSELEHGEGEWESRERWWIAHFRLINLDMLNVGDGGEFSVPDEARKRAGAKLKNRYFSPEHRARISAAKMGCKRPDVIIRNRTTQPALLRGKTLNLTDAERARRAEACRALKGLRWGRKTGEPTNG